MGEDHDVLARTDVWERIMIYWRGLMCGRGS